MVICRGYCQGYWLIGKYAQSDFEPEEPDYRTTRKLE
ncbi:hypothetical protein VII00023_05527 [Vibrio ichthyoenteri ATCC 700023]|uniref:Uncharacterized protein n=1 Tax=Vibrio ichthyoenteri ATCC 700023 TaxID=870968 RepID=F9S732_9VIBR|nr:hypothetical protein VII00023_05527 [Vibrio ichthyoenteri ATCC 700023]